MGLSLLLILCLRIKYKETMRAKVCYFPSFVFYFDYMYHIYNLSL